MNKNGGVPEWRISALFEMFTDLARTSVLAKPPEFQNLELHSF